MQLIDFDSVSFQMFQAQVYISEECILIVGQRLAGDNAIASSSRDSHADFLFAVTVAFGGINEIHSQIQSAIDH